MRGPNATVGNRVARIPKCEFFKFYFRVFSSIVNTPLRKNHIIKPLVTCQFSGTCLQSQKFVESVNRFCQQSGQLWKLISLVLFGFRSSYIYSFERVFSQLFNDVYGICLIFGSKDIGQNIRKKCANPSNFCFLGPELPRLSRTEGSIYVKKNTGSPLFLASTNLSAHACPTRTTFFNFYGHVYF
jgi:hypothetical protein